MYSFLKAEWKTILGVCIFCGSIFSWFYYQELQKAIAAEAPYVYECLNPGVSYHDYHLGAALDAISPQLTDFTANRDKTLDLVRYERSDGALALNFYHQRLTSIEYYIDKIESDPKCTSDINQLLLKSPTAVIESGERKLMLNDGFIRVLESQPVSLDNPAEKPEDKTIAWFIVPHH